MNVSPTSSITAEALARTPVKTLGQDDFLRLLVTQYTSQDPTNPVKDTDFIAQMAQFSALEQTKAIQAELSALRQDQEFLRSPDLLGRTVELKPNANTTIVGVVNAIRLENGVPKMEVNGQLYDLSLLNSVIIPEQIA